MKDPYAYRSVMRSANNHGKYDADGYKIVRDERTPGTQSNDIITRRNGGVRHQFIDDIGGCSANYK